MDIELAGGAGRPLYLQLRDQLRARLLSGAAAPGSRLPSAREMAALLHVSRNTVFEAYRMLEEEGLVRIVAGQGAFAAPRRARRRRRAQVPESFVFRSYGFSSTHKNNYDKFTKSRLPRLGIVAGRGGNRGFRL